MIEGTNGRDVPEAGAGTRPLPADEDRQQPKSVSCGEGPR
jgi:hypothetical protein